MTKEEKRRYDEPELLGDILKRLLERRIFQKERREQTDDCFDDFDEGMDDEFDSDGDGGTDSTDDPAESDNDFWDGPGERDWAIIFSLSEDIARERRDIERTRREWEDDEYWAWLNRK